MLFMVDVTDQDRLVEAREELHTLAKTMVVKGGKYIFILLNKQDSLEPYDLEHRTRKVKEEIAKGLDDLPEYAYVEFLDTPGLNVKTGKGLDAALRRVKLVLQGKSMDPNHPSPTKDPTSEPQIFTDAEKTSLPPPPTPPTRASLIAKVKTLTAVAEQDDSRFWTQFLTADIDVWDHYTHLRAGYFILISQPPSPSTLSSVAAATDAFMSHLSRLHAARPEKFRNTAHRTMTMFWLWQLERAAREQVAGTGGGEREGWPKRGEFGEVLLRKPEMMDGGLWKGWYSRERMFGGEARERWVEPDLRGLDGEVVDEGVGEKM